MSKATPSEEARQPTLDWQVIRTGVGEEFSTLDAVDTEVVWAGTYEGTVLMTADGGATINVVTPPVRPERVVGVAASSPDRALAMVTAEGRSEIYRTTDGGGSWTLSASWPGEANCLTMFGPRRGYSISVNVPNYPLDFTIATTSDGGQSWDLIAEKEMPSEYGRGLPRCTSTEHFGYFATYGENGQGAELFRTADRGQTWEEVDTHLDGYDGIQAIDFRSDREGLLFSSNGEDLLGTIDSGLTWISVPNAGRHNAQDLAWLWDARIDEPGNALARRTVLRTGYDGTDVSFDAGTTWQLFDDKYFGRVDCAETTVACWAGNYSGRLAKLVIG